MQLGIMANARDGVMLEKPVPPLYSGLRTEYFHDYRLARALSFYLLIFVFSALEIISS